jgi:hypothetical protein
MLPGAQSAEMMDIVAREPGPPVEQIRCRAEIAPVQRRVTDGGGEVVRSVHDVPDDIRRFLAGAAGTAPTSSTRAGTKGP